jgi:hypothetical protein
LVGGVCEIQTANHPLRNDTKNHPSGIVIPSREHMN